MHAQLGYNVLSSLWHKHLFILFHPLEKSSSRILYMCHIYNDIKYVKLQDCNFKRNMTLPDR